MRPIVFLDTETDGLHPGRRAWEVAMIRRDDDGQRETSFFVRIDLKYADPQALQIGCFWDRHPAGRKISGKPPSPADNATVYSAHDAAREVMAWTFGATIVGANPAFDAEVLSKLLRSEGYLPCWHYRLMDVEALTAGHLRRPVGGLAACADALDVQPGEAHTALGDAYTALAIWDAIMAGAA